MLQSKLYSEQMRVKHNGKNCYVLLVVALKCLKKELAVISGPKAQDACVQGRLKHPNILDLDLTKIISNMDEILYRNCKSFRKLVLNKLFYGINGMKVALARFLLLKDLKDSKNTLFPTKLCTLLLFQPVFRTMRFLTMDNTGFQLCQSLHMSKLTEYF